MRKTARALVFLLVMVTMFALASGTALASGYDHCAEALQAMGLFKGGSSGFELDRQATRAEAAVMLVRLLGAEEEALNDEYSHPFTDVPEWASPHIAYMYETGLTKGTGATTFTPQGVCDLQMYSTFILRALGYAEDKGDFTYAAATDFARELGVVDIFSGSGAFLRDNMVAISYTALFAPPKGTQTTLLTQLIAQEAVAEAAAEPYLALFADFAQLKSNINPFALLAGIQREVSFKMTAKIDIGALGAIEIKSDALVQVDTPAVDELSKLEDLVEFLSKLKFGMTNQISFVGELDEHQLDEDCKINLYLLDGAVYWDTNIGATVGLPVPEKAKLDISEISALLIEAGGLMDKYMDKLDDIILDSDISGGSLFAKNLTFSYYCIAIVKNIKVEDDEINVNISVANSLRSGSDEVTVKVSAQLEWRITKTGAEVKITLPGKAEDYTDMAEFLEALF